MCSGNISEFAILKIERKTKQNQWEEEQNKESIEKKLYMQTVGVSKRERKKNESKALLK